MPIYPHHNQSYCGGTVQGRVSCVVVCSQETEIDLPIVVKSERSRRIQALAIAIVSIILLGIAYYVQPSAEGVGTHTQLGLPTCGWILAADLPCPTCGMTTAWSHTVRGELPSAFIAQPMGMLLAITAMFVTVFALLTALFGYSFSSIFYRFPPSKIIIVVVLITIVSWGYKILTHRGIL